MSTSVRTVFVRNVCIERRDVHGHKEGVRCNDIGAVDIVYMSKEVHVVLYVRVESRCKWSEMIVNKNRYFFSRAAVATDYRSAVIYVITCSKCSKQYVGKTETGLNIRVNNHRSFIKTKKPDPLARHFFTNGHTFDDFQITAIDFVPHADTHMLCNKETFYIKLFQTVQPSGINSHRQDIYPIANH